MEGSALGAEPGHAEKRSSETSVEEEEFKKPFKEVEHLG